MFKNMSAWSIIFLLLVLLCCAADVWPLTCLHCTNATKPRLCKTVTECDTGQVCGMEKTRNDFGEDVYNLGCLAISECTDSGTRCLECCYTSLCNARGCGQDGYPPIHDRICYNCPVYTDSNPCHAIDFCANGEVCMFETKRIIGDLVYSSRCAESNFCKQQVVGAVTLVGRESKEQSHDLQIRESPSHVPCYGCCSEDLCNRQCNTTKALPTSVVVTRAATFSCPANPGHETQFLFEQHCYEFVTSHPVDWTHANADCIGKGGWLTDIHSASENDFIFNTLRIVGLHGDKGVWIGFNDRDREGTWIWTSGTNVNYRHWASGQPGGLTLNDEDCALLEMSSGGRWHDYPCANVFLSSAAHGWVCKFAAVPLTNSTTTSATSAGIASSTTMMVTDRPTDAVTPGTVTVVVTERPTEAITTTLPMTSMVVTENPTDAITTTLPMTLMMTSQSQAPMATDSSQQPAMSTIMEVITTQHQRR